ncbi:hypothetical protein MCOR27_007448 [Pyricularia oryzae]|nr:hypothetical protein MCOR01_008346 [Pyricularia oryzae]KAI6253031.1 hypothetical protein MCOR19_010398 [Pyricularia oryzae]KAI6267113.1 hypothetical protein MCOR26_009873 [Pyricularia oryzae]KAI6274340.1 hypothetical protein MCOR27_007448 [Pyricularia oryzae]KAI6305160.1 hypothetical protein MCOR34_008707 [Pyricularia oryzae]
MFLKQIDLTTALRPSYLPDEVLLCLQDNVGLYEGKYKLPNQQNGQVYLTSHRVCYVDKNEPRKHSVALDLKDVERYEFYAGFLKSSAKITLVPKPTKRRSGLLQQSRSPGSPSPRTSGAATPIPRPASNPRSLALDSPAPNSTATWVCTICSFSNPVPSNFDPGTANAHTPLPPCLACGIKPALTHVLKAAISNAASRPALAAPLPLRPQARPLSATDDSGQELLGSGAKGGPTPTADPEASFQCPRCTFLNHPSLMSCEICGAPLVSQGVPAELTASYDQVDSPGPFLTPVGNLPGVENPESVKLSFRGGGEKIFYERLKGSMAQRKWLLQDAPPIPRSLGGGTADPEGGSSGRGTPNERVKTAGIAGLEKRGIDLRKNNELVIGSAFEDLEALMASAKDIVALAESFARQANSGGASSEANAILAESATQLGLVTTKDTVGGSSSESLYISELARNLAEFLTDDARGVLRKAGGIISLVDLWAMFNRARGGVELVSPMDLEKAVRQWETLQLPVRLRIFKSGVMAAQGADRTDESIVKAILGWLRDLHEIPPDHEVPWDWREFGRGVTAQDAAERFGWSIGVAEEELEMAEERGVLCREEGIEGLKFWENYIDTGEGLSPAQLESKAAKEAQARIYKALRQTGML